MAAAVAATLALACWWLHGSVIAPATRPALASAPAQPPAAVSAATPPVLRFEPFTQTQVEQFLSQARKVEAINDPLQRCLAYPDPPGSHWNADAVKAYCHYRYLPGISFDEARHLIEHDHAAELDRQLADALHRQLTDPAAQGMLDHIYQNAFDDGSFDIRPTLDAWKRQSPNSAFAYAASGMAYARMAAAARGENYISNTPSDAILSMDRLAQEADTDLRHAIALDPRLTPVYAAMMNIGRMTLGRDYALQARDAGLKIAPADFLLYGAANAMAEPKWGGAPGELEALRRLELSHAAQNPLLHLNATDTRLSEFNFYSCRCDTPPELARMMHTLQDVAGFDALNSAGQSADTAQQHGLAAVYYAEVIRFANRPNDRLSRAFALVPLGYPSWAHDEISAVASQLPGKGAVYRGLGYADMELEENTRAASELEQAVRLDPTDTWSWESLGLIYGGTGQWDKAWDVADQLIRMEPDAPDGWQLRAQVQMEQPRAGLADTEQAFAERFGNRPDQQATLNHMRNALAHLKH